jgi:hypothetical protein
MKLHKHFILTLALAATALGVTASRAAAAEMYKATFNLPVEAYWGSTLMHPGEYSISMEWDYAGSSLVYLRGENVHAVILTGSVNLETASENSHLTLEEVNGAYVVRELKAGSLGKDFRFGVSKAVRRQTDRASNGAPMNVPVAAGGGN